MPPRPAPRRSHRPSRRSRTRRTGSRAERLMVKGSSLPDEKQAAPAAVPPARRPAAGRQPFRRQRDGRPPGRRALAAKGLPYLLVAPLTLFIVGLALIPAAFTIIE